ncbi:Hypothetical predicted protein [Pelobates cultripes]|uniref:Uncharacterized protein n=1 Tax=Pelobates cultripes TaxID=61616 RepID=A0AAD1WIZ7_PELCU|nr:Hypothetical predicted protein [Pelobates cultripes]
MEFNKVAVGIFLTDDERSYTWLADFLSSLPEVNFVQPIPISESSLQNPTERISECDLAILYHSKKEGELNIPDVTDSHYEKKLKYLCENNKLLLVVDDLEGSSPSEYRQILENQPNITKWTKKIFVFTKQEKTSIDRNAESLIGDSQANDSDYLSMQEKLQHIKNILRAGINVGKPQSNVTSHIDWKSILIQEDMESGSQENSKKNFCQKYRYWLMSLAIFIVLFITMILAATCEDCSPPSTTLLTTYFTENATTSMINTITSTGSTTTVPVNTSVSQGSNTSITVKTTSRPGNTTTVTNTTSSPQRFTDSVPIKTTFDPDIANTTSTITSDTNSTFNVTTSFQNSTYLPPEDTLTPESTTYIHGDTTFTPENTSTFPLNGTSVSGNTIYVSENTSFVPLETTPSPGNTTLVGTVTSSENTSHFPSTTNVTSGNTINTNSARDTEYTLANTSHFTLEGASVSENGSSFPLVQTSTSEITMSVLVDTTPYSENANFTSGITTETNSTSDMMSL